MLRRPIDRILLIGDTQRQVEAAMAQAMPAVAVTHVDNYFEGIAELSSNRYGAVLANAEPIERRPDAAVRALREVAKDGRVILFGHPTLEPVSRKMMEFGCDDYVIAPPKPGELQSLLSSPVMRIAPPPPETADQHARPPATIHSDVLESIVLSDILLDALVAHPGTAAPAAAKAINEKIRPDFELKFIPGANDPVPAPLSASIRAGDETFGHLHLTCANASLEPAGRRFLDTVVEAFTKVAALEDRHNRLTKLATTDQLTGVANRRFFEHFLAKLLDKARAKRIPVSLFLFDIDNFKKYNDECGHAMGDEILKETAALMKRCCRKHDLVARIGGDEFAVVFWEKEGPRQPKEGVVPAGVPGRVPQEPVQILKRFRRLIAARQFTGLGPAGRGTLTISGGLASFPWDGRNVDELVQAADKALLFGAKKSGKNSVYLVGGNEQTWGDEG
jgi:GGDEF domain-containing protein